MKHPLVGLCLFLAALFAPGGDARASNEYITIGTGGLTGVYYPAGGSICRLVNKGWKQHGIRCSVDNTGGSRANAAALAEGEIDIGIVQSDVHALAYEGRQIFASEGPNRALRSLFSLHPEPFTVVVRSDAGIKTFLDIKGKRVNIGNTGSGHRITMDMLMESLGWTPDVFAIASELKSAEQSQALCDNKIDVIIFLVGHPNGSIHEATTSCDAVLLPVDGAEITQMVGTHSSYEYGEIPGGLYPMNPEAIPTFEAGATTMTTTELSDEIAYELVRSVFDDFDAFKGMHPALRNLDRAKMPWRWLTAPLHEGAERFYREAGLL